MFWVTTICLTQLVTVNYCRRLNYHDKPPGVPWRLYVQNILFYSSASRQLQRVRCPRRFERAVPAEHHRHRERGHGWVCQRCLVPLGRQSAGRRVGRDLLNSWPALHSGRSARKRWWWNHYSQLRRWKRPEWRYSTQGDNALPKNHRKGAPDVVWHRPTGGHLDRQSCATSVSAGKQCGAMC